jgi:threonine dehydratase
MHSLIAMGAEGVQSSSASYTLPTIEDIFNARNLLSGTPIRKTPLQASDTFSRLAGTNLFLKIESLQRTGSFKVRGAFVKLNTLSEEQCRYGVIAASAGNHAQGVAYAASKKNISCTIVMPNNASPAKVAATRSYGAKVVLKGSDYDECWIATQELAKTEGRAIIHAFDDPQIISGQGTIGLERLYYRRWYLS